MTQAALRPRRADYVLLSLVGVLLLVGLQALYSASFAVGMKDYNDPAYFITRQLTWASVGLVALLVTWRIPYWHWRTWSPIMLGIALASVFLVYVPGIGKAEYGASRWIAIGPLPAVQPSEFVKLSAAIYFAAWLANRQGQLRTVGEGVIPYFLVLGAIVVPVALQPDFGTATVTASIALSLYFLGGAPVSYLVGVLGTVLLVAVPFMLQAGYRASRMEAFLDPWKDPSGKGFHIIQALIAIGSGGLTGLGIGSSRQKFSYVFGSESDAIFAIIGEELGLLGSVLVISLFALVGYRGFRTALRCPDRFGALLAAGITTWFLVQAFINVAGITRTLPFTGIPLPFISHGGSSLAISLAAIGIVLNISRYATGARSEDQGTTTAARTAGRARHPAHQGI